MISLKVSFTNYFLKELTLLILSWNLLNEHTKSHWGICTLSDVHYPHHFSPALTLAFAFSTFFILFLCSFSCFLEVMSWKSVFEFIFLCIIEGIINHAKAIVLPPPKLVLSPNTKIISGVVLYILASFSWISVLDTVHPGWRMLMTICFHWSNLLVMNILVQTIAMLFIMMATHQAAREEKTSNYFWWYIKMQLILCFDILCCTLLTFHIYNSPYAQSYC